MDHLDSRFLSLLNRIHVAFRRSSQPRCYEASMSISLGQNSTSPIRRRLGAEVEFASFVNLVCPGQQCMHH